VSDEELFLRFLELVGAPTGWEGWQRPAATLSGWEPLSEEDRAAAIARRADALLAEHRKRFPREP